MNSLPAVGSGLQSASQYFPPAGQSATSTSATLANPSASQRAANSGNSGLAQRVDQLNAATQQLAQGFLGDFAKQVFGAQANGMTISFDSIDQSATSTASASLSATQGSKGSSANAQFSLEDSSSFVGKGTLTTADGKKFSFEVDVSYESLQQASYGITNAASGTPATTSATPASQAPASASLPKLSFGGIADDLLKQLSATPVSQPFTLSIPQAQGDALKVPGNLILKLLNLSGGDRYVNLPAVGQDNNATTAAVSTTA